MRLIIELKNYQVSLKIIYKKRNIKVHRTDIPIQKHIHVSMLETISLNDAISTTVYDKDGKIRNADTKSKIEDKIHLKEKKNDTDELLNRSYYSSMVF